MNMRVLPIVAILFLMMLPAGAGALVLGDEQIRSTLDQPLRLEIQLLDWRSGDLDRLEVGLASREDFEAFELPYPAYLERLSFSVEQGDDGGAFIRVSSDRPIVEPYINLLVSARWPGGAVLREYVVLLDLPGTPLEESGQAAPVSAAPEQNAEPASPAPSRTPPEPKPLPGPGDEPETRNGRETYVVQPGDTLWSIAQRFHPGGSDTNLYQTLVRLHELNPDAFVNTNITLMRANHRMTLPTAADVRQVEAGMAREIYESRTTQGQARVDALRRGDPLPEFTDFAVLGSERSDRRASEDSRQDTAETGETDPRRPSGRERPRTDDSVLRLSFGAEDEGVRASDSMPAADEAEPDAVDPEAILREEVSMLESLLRDREADIQALEAEVLSLTSRLEEAESTVARVTTALRVAREESQSEPLQQAPDNRGTILFGGLSGVLALLLLLAGSALFRMKLRLEEQREELEALSAGPGFAAVGGLGMAGVVGDRDEHGYDVDDSDEDEESDYDPGQDGEPLFGFEVDHDNDDESAYGSAYGMDEVEEYDEDSDEEDVLADGRWSDADDRDSIDSADSVDPETDDEMFYWHSETDTEEAETEDDEDAPRQNFLDEFEEAFGEAPARDAESPDNVTSFDVPAGSGVDQDEVSAGEAVSGEEEAGDDLPEMFEFRISDDAFDRDGKDADDNSAAGNEDNDEERIESVDFNLDDLLIDLVEEEGEGEASRDVTVEDVDEPSDDDDASDEWQWSSSGSDPDRSA